MPKEHGFSAIDIVDAVANKYAKFFLYGFLTTGQSHAFCKIS